MNYNQLYHKKIQFIETDQIIGLNPIDINAKRLFLQTCQLRHHLFLIDQTEIIFTIYIYLYNTRNRVYRLNTFYTARKTRK